MCPIYHPKSSIGVQKIGLGTVQFGLNYGISNKAGQPSSDEVAKIVETAWNFGIRILDTAAAYGISEEVLGKTMSTEHPFSIITKIPKINDKNRLENINVFIKKTFEESLKKLRRDSVYALLFHNAEDLLSDIANDAWATLEKLKDDGFVQKIGVSAYTQNQLELIHKIFNLDIVQIPVNVFDQRLVQSGYLRKLHESGVEIHTRSTFLQGLVLMKPELLSSYFQPILPYLQRFHAEAIRQNTNPLTLALAYINSLKIVDHVIIGVTENIELQEILKVANRTFQIDYDQFSVTNERILNPSNWQF